MRKKLSVDVVQLSGSNYIIGVRQGKEVVQDQNYQWLKTITGKTETATVQSILTDTAKGFLEEIKGISDGLNLEYDTALGMYSGYNLPFPPMGCTAFTQNNYYARNYDFTPEMYDGRLVFHQPKMGFASVGFSQQTLGRLDGMNEHGLVVGLHLVNEEHKGDGFIGTTIVRLVLDNCKNVGEAIDLITKLPHGYCYNYSLFDKQGIQCLIEASPEQQVVNQQKSLSCTNHFEVLEGKNRTNTEGSLQRKKTLQTLKSDSHTPEDAFHLLNDEDSPLFFKHYRQFFGTLHTVVYIPETLELIIGIGGNAKPVKFSLAKWLQGAEKLETIITGEIDY